MHTGGFTRTTTALLGVAGGTADQLNTQATVTVEQVAGAWTITKVALVMQAVAPGNTAEKFTEIAKNAEAQWPGSRVLKAEISLDAKWVSGGQLRVAGRIS